MQNEIEQMANAIEEARIKASDTTNSMNYGFGGWYAKELYAKGYRKASEVAREIFEEIDKIINARCVQVEISERKMIAEIAELKKKYTEE